MPPFIRPTTLTDSYLTERSHLKGILSSRSSYVEPSQGVKNQDQEDRWAISRRCPRFHRRLKIHSTNRQYLRETLFYFLARLNCQFQLSRSASSRSYLALQFNSLLIFSVSAQTFSISPGLLAPI